MIKAMFFKRMAVTLVIATSLLFLGACSNQPPEIIDSYEIEISPLPDNLLAFMQSVLFGFQFNIGSYPGFADPNFDLDRLDLYEPFYGHIQLESTDTALFATIENMSYNDHYFILKLLLNYEEVPFRVMGEVNYATEYHFFLEGGYEMVIPLLIDSHYISDDTTYKLTSGIFVDLPLDDKIHREDDWWSRGSFSNLATWDLPFGDTDGLMLDLDYNLIPLQRNESMNLSSLIFTPYLEELEFVLGT